MLTYLHAPVRDPAAVKQLVQSHAEENQHLDFKGSFWDEGEEAAKDIAAYANADGGTIVVGVSDSGDRASGWYPTPGARGKTAKLRDWMNGHLTPRELAGEVEVIELDIEDGGLTHDAMVVNVPPWPRGLVGVETTKRKRDDRVYVLFPYRDRKVTRFMTFDQAAGRTSGHTRSMFLRLRELTAQGGGGRATFASPVGILIDHQVFAVPLMNGGHAHNLTVTTTEATVEMESFSSAAANLKLQMSSRGIDIRALIIPPNLKLVVPLELVEAAWRGADGGNVHLALRATILWDGERWSLSVGGPLL